MPMQSKEIIIFGGSRGIGGALVSEFRRKGKRVIHGSRDAPEDADSCKVDLASGDGVSRLLELSKSEQALVIVTAGILGPIGRAEDTSATEWLETINVNLLGSLRVYQQCSKFFGTKAKIVFMSGGGVGGFRHQPRVLPYVVSKTALVSMVEELSREPRSSRPLVTAVAPGVFPTSFTKEIGTVDPDLSGEELRKEFSELVTKKFEISNLLGILEFIDTDQGEICDGILVSANRDFPSGIVKSVEDSRESMQSYGKMRRIDGTLFYEGELD